MSNTDDRNKKEMQNLFGDPKFARKAWKAVGAAIAASPVSRTIEPVYDKDGNIALPSLIETYSYNKLKRDIDSLSLDERREPTELELILQCQMVRARYDTSAAVFIRDTLGAKPVDESKMDATVNNPYEDLSDEELELLAQHREAKQKLQKEQVHTLSMPATEEETV